MPANKNLFAGSVPIVSASECCIFVGHCLTERAHLKVDICIYLTTLLLVDTTYTGFSLVDFNEALEIQP